MLRSMRYDAGTECLGDAPVYEVVLADPSVKPVPTVIHTACGPVSIALGSAHGAELAGRDRRGPRRRPARARRRGTEGARDAGARVARAGGDLPARLRPDERLAARAAGVRRDRTERDARGRRSPHRRRPGAAARRHGSGGPAPPAGVLVV